MQEVGVSVGSDALLNAKLSEALEATRAFIQVLEAEGLAHWVQRFGPVADALEAGDIRGALHLHDSTSSSGSGSLSDVFANDQQRFNRAWATCGTAIRKLRAYRVAR